MSRTREDSRTRVRTVRLLVDTIHVVGGQRIFVVFLAFVCAVSAALALIEPQTFPTFGSALWHAFQTITTIGYGDVVPTLPATRALTMVLGLSSLFVVALLTGIVVQFFGERVSVLRHEGLHAFDERMSRLSEMSHDELQELERQWNDFARRSGLR